jgi:inner membrane protein
MAAAAPDVDSLAHHFLHVPIDSVYAHRGAAHSLFVALAAWLLAAACHKWLRVRAATAGIVIGGAMASHGLLDMMTDSGLPVAYLWPLSSLRLVADWRPIHSTPVHMTHLVAQIFARLRSELWQLIVPMFAAAIAIRAARKIAPPMANRASEPRRRRPKA